MASSAITLSVVATGESSLAAVHVGTSGWSYPSWKPGFYPAGTDAKEFLRFYAERFATVELNTTGYRIPGEEQFARWAEQTPPGFRFAPKLAGNRPRMLAEFGPRVRALGDRLGPIRVQLISARDEGMIELILGSLDPDLLLAFDLSHPSWDGIEPRLAQAIPAFPVLLSALAALNVSIALSSSAPRSDLRITSSSSLPTFTRA